MCRATSVVVLATGICTYLTIQAVAVEICPILIDGRLDDTGWKQALVWTTGDRRITEDRFTCRVAYDETFVYLAADVADHDVRGTHASPAGEVFKDDAIEFFFEVDRARAKDRTPRTFEYGFSPAGGYSNVTGKGTGDGSHYPGYVWPPSFKSKIDLKIVLKPDTTLNDAGDRDQGFIVEARIPWSEWGVKGADMIGRSMGFNVIKICRPEQQPPTEVPLSLAPGLTFADNHNPSLWRNLTLFHHSRLKPPNREHIQRAISAAFKPDQRIVGTHYFYWYRWPDQHFWDDPDWTDDALQDHVAKPETVSFDSPAWHERQLRDVMSAGIDFILPVYWGAPDNYLKEGIAFSVLGLPPMIEALDKIAKEGKTPPKVGLFYDSSTLLTGVRGLGEPGNVLDLTTDHGKDVFCRTIRDFFCMIPPRYWAMLEGKPIVVLYGTFGAKHDQSTIDSTTRRFEQESGCRPYIIRNADWKCRTDAVTSWGAALSGPQIIGPSRPGAIVQIGPGYNDRAVPGRTTPVRQRDDGGFYQASWHQAVKSARNIVIVETWNELHEGTDVCESREYGRKYIDLTARYARAFKQALPLPPFDYEPSDLSKTDRGRQYTNAKEVSYEPAQERGIYHLPALEDGRGKIVDVAGRKALQSMPNNASSGRYLYFAVADPYVFNTKGAVEFAIEYLDAGRGQFQVQYDSRDIDATLLGAYKDAAPVALTDTGAWKTATIRPVHPRLANRQNDGADFRLAVLAADLTIRRIVLRKLD
ncbi:MAG: DUF5010 domain-containing protein [Phycisphaerae bacterium]|nr:DUF5010 domain-containing protein [Phycisphaerae bacterium]